MADMQNPKSDPRDALRRLCDDRGEDFASLSRLIGRNAAYIQQFIRRGTPKRLAERERRILARHFGVPEQLLGAEGSAAPLAGLVALASLGGDLRETPLAFAPDWLARLTPASPDHLRLLTILGEAMAPTIQSGDEVVVDCSDRTSRLRDGLYALEVEGVPQVRRLTMHPIRPEVTVQSDHPAYADWPGVARDELRILGRVVWAGRRIA